MHICTSPHIKTFYDLYLRGFGLFQVRQMHLIAPLDKHFSLLSVILKEHIADDVDYKVCFLICKQLYFRFFFVLHYETHNMGTNLKKNSIFWINILLAIIKCDLTTVLFFQSCFTCFWSISNVAVGLSGSCFLHNCYGHKPCC